MNLDELALVLRSEMRGRVETGLLLAPLTTYRLGGPARLYVEPIDTRDLECLAATLRSWGLSSDELPVLAIGRGSNLVVSDSGWPGLVLHLGSAWAAIEQTQSGEHPVVRAGAAASLPQVANWVARRGLAGLEFGVSIPASVGGAVRMNAGAHGRDMSGCVRAAVVFDLAGRTLNTVPREELGFSYRRSALKETDLVVAADLGLTPGDPEAIRALMEAHRKHRAATQPGAAQNAGSVFKNPPGDSAGRLVEAAGLKGFRVGGAAVSELHANFFIAEEGATAADVYRLVTSVRRRILDEFGIDLEPEVRFAGAFDEP